MTSHIWALLPLNLLTSEYDYDAPLEKWTAILRLAHLWQFPKIKALATRKLDRIDIEPVDKAVMAREYQIDPAYGWLEQAYAAIGEREESISQSEGERLGLDAVVRLANLRERVQKTRFEQEKNTLLRNIHESPRPSPVVSARPSPSSPHGGLELREEDAIENTPADIPPRSPSGWSFNFSPIKSPPKSPVCYTEQLPVRPADGSVPPGNTLNSAFNVSIPLDFSFGTQPSVPTPVTTNAAYEPTDSLEPFGGGGGKKGKKGKKGKRSLGEEESAFTAI